MLRTPKKPKKLHTVLSYCKEYISPAPSYTFGYGKDKVVHFAAEECKSIAEGLGLVLGAIKAKDLDLSVIKKVIPNKKTKGVTILFSSGYIVFGQPNAEDS